MENRFNRIIIGQKSAEWRSSHPAQIAFALSQWVRLSSCVYHAEEYMHDISMICLENDIDQLCQIFTNVCGIGQMQKLAIDFQYVPGSAFGDFPEVDHDAYFYCFLDLPDIDYSKIDAEINERQRYMSEVEILRPHDIAVYVALKNDQIVAGWVKLYSPPEHEATKVLGRPVDLIDFTNLNLP